MDKPKVVILGGGSDANLAKALIKALDKHNLSMFMEDDVIPRTMEIMALVNKECDIVFPDERQTRNRPDGWYRQFEKENKRKNFTKK